jgi:voltage-gated potassium channel
MADKTKSQKNNEHDKMLRKMHNVWKSPIFQFKIVVLLFIILVAIGVTYYRAWLHWDIREAFLQIVLTVCTLGGNVRDINQPTTQWFSIFYNSSILLVVLWGVTLLIEAMVSGEMVFYWGKRKMYADISKLRNHYVICGFGRMGQEIARQLDRTNTPFVVVEHNPGQFANMEESGVMYIKGDAREDEQLTKAGIQYAKGLISVAQTDEENVYITLSARVLNPNLYIVTRSSSADAEPKLIRAGANRVFSPYVVGGRRMAQSIMQPSVVDFLDAVVHGEEVELILEEITVSEGAAICSSTFDASTDVEELGVHLLGIITKEGKVLMRDLRSYHAKAGDTFILLGEPTAIQTTVERLLDGSNDCISPKVKN